MGFSAILHIKTYGPRIKTALMTTEVKRLGQLLHVCSLVGATEIRRIKITMDHSFPYPSLLMYIVRNIFRLFLSYVICTSSLCPYVPSHAKESHPFISPVHFYSRADTSQICMQVAQNACDPRALCWKPILCCITVMHFGPDNRPTGLNWKRRPNMKNGC